MLYCIFSFLYYWCKCDMNKMYLNPIYVLSCFEGTCVYSLPFLDIDIVQLNELLPVRTRPCLPHINNKCKQNTTFRPQCILVFAQVIDCSVIMETKPQISPGMYIFLVRLHIFLHACTSIKCNKYNCVSFHTAIITYRHAHMSWLKMHTICAIEHAQDCLLLCRDVVIPSVLMDLCNVITHILQGCFTGTIETISLT